MGKLTTSTPIKGGIHMDNTHEFVEKIQDQQKKQEQNKKRQGKGHPGDKLPNHKH